MKGYHGTVDNLEDENALDDLRRRLGQARAGERRAQALLESAASLMRLSDPEQVLRGIAENAVRHLGMPEVSVYRVDHDEGQLGETVRTKVGGPTGAVPLPGMAPVEEVPADTEPIEIRPGHPLADFALGESSDRLLSPETDDGQYRLLVRMCASGGPGENSGSLLIGIIVASGFQEPASWQVDLLGSLASLGAAAVETARMQEFRAQIVSAVSHEFRTPLAAIRAYNELLLDEDAGEINEEQRLFLQRIEATCLQLDRMVDDLLDLSRLRAGEMVISRSPVDVVEVIEHIIDTLSPEADRRDVTLKNDIIGDPPMISSNSDRLAQVLFNLVGNAVKYVDEGGSVVVRTHVDELESCAAFCDEDVAEGSDLPTDGACLIIDVIDNGPGIPADELDRVFDEFFRGRLTEGSSKGSGLGLAIASRLTRLLGGVLEVESTPGEGSTFSVIFPIEDSAGEDETQEVDE